VLRLGVITVLLLTVLTVLIGASQSSAQPKVEHSCGLTDREFLQIASFQVETVGTYGDDYRHGNARAKEVIAAAREAARAVHETAPFDTSLQTAKHYLPVMFLQYADAVEMQDAGKDAGPAMFRSYSIAARVHFVLTGAQAVLKAAGCDVTGLL
jgi:hypothetical protein